MKNENHRLQMGAISTLSLCNTEESLRRNTITVESDYWSPALADVEVAMRREILLIKKVNKLKELLLLTDPVVGHVCVGDTQLKQHQEFLKTFQDERIALGIKEISNE